MIIVIITISIITGKRDSTHHQLLEAISESGNMLELRQRLLYTTPSGWWWWWWCIESVFRITSQSRSTIGS